MDLLKQIEELDFAFLLSFSTKQNQTWGILFSNPDQPGYNDANHAYLNEEPDFPKEVISFYKYSNITPRFYLDNVPSLTKFIAQLKKRLSV